MAGRDAELEAVESALNTLALADSDKALERVVGRLLPALLSALATKSAPARAKCIQTLQHINVRVRASPTVPLPFEGVLAVAVAPDAAEMTRNVAIHGGYLARCFQRYASPERAFVPLVQGASSMAQSSNADALMALALSALHARVRTSKSLANSDEALRLLAEDLTDDQRSKMFGYALRAVQKQTKEAASNEELLAAVRLASEYAGVQQPERAATVFPFLLVSAGTPSRSDVAEAGQDAMKRVDTCDVLLQHDPSLVQTLFALFLDARAEIPLRSLIISKGLLRATLSASCFPEVHNVVEESVYKPGLPDRLRALGMEYVSFVVKHATEASIRDNSGPLLLGLLRVIRDETDGSPSFSPKVRGFAYTALAELLVRVPSLRAQHAHLTPGLYFGAAQSATEPAEVRAAAAQALQSLASVFVIDDEAQESIFLRDLILGVLMRTVENADDSASSARAAAILWANQCFPFNDASARLVNVVGAGDSRPDVRDAALAGLSDRRFRSALRSGAAAPSSEEGTSSGPLKRLKTESGAAAEQSTNKEAGTPDSVIKSAATASTEYPSLQGIMNELNRISTGEGGRTPVRLRAGSLAAFLRFALRVLRRNVRDSLGLEGSVETPADIVRYSSPQPSVSTALEQLRSLADRCLLDEGQGPGLKAERSAVLVLLYLGQINPSTVADKYCRHMDTLIEFCERKSASGGGALTHGVAQLCGLAATKLSAVEATDLISRLEKRLAPDESGRASGRHNEDGRVASALCLGCIAASVKERSIEVGEDVLSTAAGALARRTLAAVEGSTAVRIAACDALGTMGSRFELPLPLNHAEAGSESTVPTREVVLGGLTGILKSDKPEARLVEATATAVGRLCVGERRLSFKRTVIGALLECARIRKEEEVRFTVGESLVRATVGFDAPPPQSTIPEDETTEEEDLAAYLAMPRTPLTIQLDPEDDPTSTAAATGEDGQDNVATTTPHTVGDVVKAVVRLCYNERPYSRVGGCVLLVSFLRMVGTQHAKESAASYQFAGEDDLARFKSAQDALDQTLPLAQDAFTTLLADRSDFAQQLASRGIALVYEQSGPSGQRELVSTLVRSLTSGRQRAGTTVAGDEGAVLDLNGLPIRSSGDGGSSSTGSGSTGGNGAATYRELCALATDMGQPELLYKFLDLAGHNALWNSRRGAALAGTAMLGNDIAAEQLRPHVKTLMPRLYVYCYDPSEGVRLAMSSVLQSVAQAAGYGSVSVAVTEHFDAVAEHTLSCMTGRQWRVREAGSAALRDLLSSRRWPEVENHLEQFWYVGLRAMDDIKESVRTAAGGLGRALAALSVRLCDPGLSGEATAAAAVQVVIPCILPAFTHGVQEVRVLITDTLSKVIRHGGAALKPSVPQIMESLLEAATELEPQALNYYQFHVDDDEKDRLEEARADMASTSSSPVMDSLERLASLVDEEISGAVASRLARLARIGVGIPTRAATARFVSTLLSGRGVIMEPHATKLMGAAAGAAEMETSASARRSWSNAVGLAARLAPDSAVGSLVDRIVEMSGSEHAQDRGLASYLAYGLWHVSPETARKHATAVLPIAYMGRYEGDESAKGAAGNWKEVWSEGSPSSDAGLRLYAKEITQICTHRLTTSTQYKVKRSAAVALGALAAAYNSSVGMESLARAAKVLVGTLPGHIWDGKEAALEALGTIGRTVADADRSVNVDVWDDVGGPHGVVTALLRECVRGKREYRQRAMQATADVLSGVRDCAEFVGDVRDALGELWSDSSSAGSGDGRSAAAHVAETGDDAMAVAERTLARKAERATTVAALRCLAAAFPSAARADWQATHVAYVVGVLSSDAVLRGRGEREVRVAALGELADVCGRLDAADADGDLAQRVSARAIECGVTDTRFEGVRAAAYRVLARLVARGQSTAGGESRAWDALLRNVDGERRAAVETALRADADTLPDARALRDLISGGGGVG